MQRKMHVFAAYIYIGACRALRTLLQYLIYMYVCILGHEHTRTCICLPACKQMFTHIFAYAGPFVLSYIWYIFISVYIHMYAHAGVYMYTYINIHTNYMYVYA